nr:hybrid signal transduction histidine kinase M [Tanacetum cinerariifolium]
GENSSIAFCASDFPGCKGNCIYYTDDYSEWNYDGADGSHDLGVYNVEKGGSVEALPCYPENLYNGRRALTLDNELRSFKIRKMTINKYCTKIRSMADRLKNLGGEVSDKNLVIYTINGLDSRFATLVEIIRHREPLPSFETTRTMLLLKESSFSDSIDASTMLESSSSSSTILLSSSTNSKGDLYPVTRPSTLPAAFVSTSSSTWQQRLGHPGDEVLRSLSLRHFISCNKTKSTHIFHACQLGKHVKLSFHNSTSLVKQYFDIIHSDLWTSPIREAWRNDMTKPHALAAKAKPSRF